MKKIKYYERCRNEEGHTFFDEKEGYLEEYFDIPSDKKIKVCYRRDDKGLWKATHYDSGLSIDYGLLTRNKAVESVKKRLQAVITRLQDKDVRSYIYELTEYKNSLIEGMYKL